MEIGAHDSSEEGSVRCRNCFREVAPKSVQCWRLECKASWTGPISCQAGSGKETSCVTKASQDRICSTSRYHGLPSASEEHTREGEKAFG